MMLLAAALLAVAAPTPAPKPANASPAGLYEIRQMEMAGGLELKADGRFRYAFSYGALDEQTEGVWSVAGNEVLLTSKPMPKEPSFELVHDLPAPKGELYLALEDPGFQWGSPLEVIASADLKSGFEISAGENGKVDLTGKPPIIAVAPKMPVYGSTGQIFRLSSDRGHRLLFRFHRNDLGKVAFDKQALTRDGSNLQLKRHDTVIRFIRVQR